jgi:uncharacterized protein (TIGR03435 family)
VRLPEFAGERFTRIAAAGEHMKSQSPILHLAGSSGSRIESNSNVDCSADPIGSLTEMFVGMVQGGRINMVLTGSRDATMAALARWLSGSGPADLDRTVVDQTGLDGMFDFSLKWAYVPPGSSPSDTANLPEFMGMTFKRALNEQLGLNLKPTIAPVDFFLVDHIETPSPN